MSERRKYHLTQFYQLLTQLERKLGGARRLSECSGRMGWPQRGVYFFRETGENRSDTGVGPRIVRVGTHALRPGERTKIWDRLKGHKGTASSGGGSHRGSVFRKIVGTALIERDGYSCPSWGAPKADRKGEHPLEKKVSAVIGAMPFLWLAVDDAPGPDSCRGYIERNSIALLSNYGKTPIDPPSPTWLGHYSDRERVRSSGLWNSNHVDETYDPAFLDCLERLIEGM